MSPRLCGWLLWVAVVIALPLPGLFIPGDSFVPAARYLQLAAVLVGVVAVEGTEGVAPLLALLMGANALVAMALEAAVVRVLVRGLLVRLPMRLRDHLTVIAIAVLVGLGFYKPGFYDTQFHHSDAHASLPELYR